ncbi:1-acyl-sn-glycerol-3-phosphate acyltransferase [Aerococcaceae bacterium DSM 111020]|nr:1-acyl-sn-glycerol-3-phosphate acyltransferase [Aerococcaceae bacterium DSM 111020]
MFFYHLALAVSKFILYLLNGKPEIYGLENLPENDNVILASTHRSNWDPFIIANTIKPRHLRFMAKESLFQIPLFGYMMRSAGMIPVNRENPGRKAIKSAITVLSEGNDDFAIFPTGTRHSTELKSGTAFIQRMSKKDIIPIAIQPPLGWRETLGRKKAKVYFGKPIPYLESVKYDKAKLAEVDQALAEAFDDLDQQLDPTFEYDPSVHQK